MAILFKCDLVTPFVNFLRPAGEDLSVDSFVTVRNPPSVPSDLPSTLAAFFTFFTDLVNMARGEMRSGD